MLRRLQLYILSALAFTLVVGCPFAPTDTGNDNGGTGGINTNDNAGTGAGDVSDDAFSFSGTATGSVRTSSSTDAGGGFSTARRKSDFRALSNEASAWLEDLNGHRLLNADRNVYPNLTVNDDGSFEISDAPVGVHFVIAADLDGDGKADMWTVVIIPRNENDNGGEIDDVVCDPLSTLAFVRLAEALKALGLTFEDLGTDAASVIGRVRDAYENLFADSGIFDEITIDEILGLTPEELSDLFDARIPDNARRAFKMIVGHIRLAQAEALSDIVISAAQILLEGGFAVADDPGGIDLSILGDLDGVSQFTFSDFREMNGTGDDQVQLNRPRPIVYVSTVSEPNRNFPEADQANHHPGPIISEHVLTRLAALYAEGKTVSLNELYELIVSAENGMGVRYRYRRPRGPGLTPIDVFPTENGAGREIDMTELIEFINSLNLGDPDPETFQTHRDEIRQRVISFLANTQSPTIEQLFGGFMIDPIPTIDDYARFLRGQLAHLPFSRSGPAELYVVATDDPFQNGDAQAVTVDLEFGDEGELVKVTYNAEGAGGWWLSYGQPVEDGNLVLFLNTATGKPLHDFRGRPLWVDMNSTKFEGVNGESFFDSFSITETYWAGAPALRAPNPEFNPDEPADPETNPPDVRLFVLMTAPRDGTPVRVDFADNVATFNENGQYYLLFVPETPTDGLFGLVSEDGTLLVDSSTDPDTPVLIHPGDIEGITIEQFEHTRVFGISIPNPGYDADGAPYYDDINGNDVEDADEPRFDVRPFLHNPDDWRSTRVEIYYRRADDGGFVTPDEVDFNADSPMTIDEVELVARELKPRLNAFRYGRPNVAINLITAFVDPDFFNGTHSLNGDTRINPFAALALVNLAFESIHNVTAQIDYDGSGPLPAREELINADLWVMPIGDPVSLMVDAFEARAGVETN